MEFANLSSADPVVAENLTITSNTTFLDIMTGITLGIEA